MTDLLNLLVSMRSGKVIADCNDKFNEVLSAVLDTGQKGEFAVKISIKPSKFGMGGIVVEVETEHDIKTKVPELAIGRSVFFVGNDGALTREDPEQSAMFEEETERKEVGHA